MGLSGWGRSVVELDKEVGRSTDCSVGKLDESLLQTGNVNVSA